MKTRLAQKFYTAFFAFSAIFFAAQASAADFSFRGNFSGDLDVVQFPFTVGTAGTVTIRTWGYAGGTNAAGATIPSGGFDPQVQLFDGDGVFIDDNDDGTGVADDPDTGNDYDSLLEVDLTPGNYIATITQYNNDPVEPNLSDGFDDDVDFDDQFDGRSSAWALDILNVASASGPGVSTPPTAVPTLPFYGMCIMILGLLLVGSHRLRIQARAT